MIRDLCLAEGILLPRIRAEEGCLQTTVEQSGHFAACPDTVDVRAYGIVNVYEHENAYYYGSRWKQTPRPATRNYLGETLATSEEANHYELALGTNARSRSSSRFVPAKVNDGN